MITNNTIFWVLMIYAHTSCKGNENYDPSADKTECVSLIGKNLIIFYIKFWKLSS